MTLILAVTIVGLALWAIETLNFYVFGATGVLVALYLFLLGAPFTATLQLITVGAITFVLQRQLAGKMAVKNCALEWLANAVTVFCLIATLLVAANLAVTLPLSVKISDLYFGVIILVIGLYGISLKKDLRQILISLIVMQLATEIIVTALGETASFTPLLGLLMIWIMTGIIARLDDLDLTKLQELKG